MTDVLLRFTEDTGTTFSDTHKGWKGIADISNLVEIYKYWVYKKAGLDNYMLLLKPSQGDVYKRAVLDGGTLLIAFALRKPFWVSLTICGLSKNDREQLINHIDANTMNTPKAVGQFISSKGYVMYGGDTFESEGHGPWKSKLYIDAIWCVMKEKDYEMVMENPDIRNPRYRFELMVKEMKAWIKKHGHTKYKEFFEKFRQAKL